MTDFETCFLALEPEEPFARAIRAYKRRVRDAAGAQRYLDHPPHLTLYLGVFGPGADLRGAVGRLGRRLPAPTVAVRGWHVFEADPLTGNPTLVCDVAPETRVPLKRVQRDAAGAVAPLRDVELTRARYEGAWHRLSDEGRANVERFGFPFVGPIWHPHVTIASVRPGHWDAVWSELAGAPPEATVRLPHLSIYALRGEEAILVERFALEGVG